MSMEIPSFSYRFETISKELLHNGSLETLTTDFSNLTSDADRVAHIYDLPLIKKIFEIFTSYKVKSNTESVDLRSQGNVAFQKSLNDEALCLYNGSVVKAVWMSEELALAFGNRSAVLFYMKYYANCLNDIDLALKHGYPNALRFKLYDRKGKCYVKLAQIEDACSCFKQAREYLDQSKLDTNKLHSLKGDIEKQIAQTESQSTFSMSSDQRFYLNHDPLPDICADKCSKSVTFPCASDMFSLAYSSDRGRYPVAGKDIAVGDVIAVEKPYCSVLLEDFTLSHCHKCCERVLCPVPCFQCSGVVYCSEKCQDEAWKKYHYAECQYLNVLYKSDLGLGHLALRMVISAGFGNLMKYKLQEKSDCAVDGVSVGFSSDGVYHSDRYHAAYHLVNHSKDRHISDIFQRTLKAAFLLKILQQTPFITSVGADINYDDLFQIGGHILRNIMMLPCNAHEVSDFEIMPSDFASSGTKEIASACYNVLSLINHACDPNVVRNSYGEVCVVRAFRPIAKGEVIYDNYGALYALSSRAERREHLCSQYYFQCDCYTCINDWPLYFDIQGDVPVFKCDACSGPVFISDILTTTDRYKLACSDCKIKHDITPKLQQYNKSDDQFQIVLHGVLKGLDLDSALAFLIGHLHLMDCLIYRPWKSYNDCQEAIKQIYNFKSNHYEASE